jgi:2-keto-4-pentenoate hydratase/2-oxohepta-3-ene-1,7-dioic acid hydratase in catechol pathway
MKIVRFEAEDGRERVGLLEGKRVIDLSRALPMYLLAEGYPPLPAPFSILDLLKGGAFDVDLFREVCLFVERHDLASALTVATLRSSEATSLRTTSRSVRLLAPIARPPRIVALGLNYAAHAAETGKAPPKEPIFFVKASTAVIGPEESVVCPRGIGRVDHEVELAVIIGKGGRHIPRGKVAQHIAGYTILNDVTARDMQSRDMAASRPWFLSKSLDTFAPMGPCVTLPDEIVEPCELDLVLRVNGKVRQKSNTRDLIFNVTELIHRLSRYLTLEPGDVIATGTPSGISPVRAGDVMEAEIERIGVLRNPVIAGR